MQKRTVQIFLLRALNGVRIAQSVQRLVTGWMVRGSNLGGGEIFRTRPDRPWGLPSLPNNGYRVFPGVKRPGRGIDHPPHLAPRLKKEYSCNCSPSLGRRGLFKGELYWTVRALNSWRVWRASFLQVQTEEKYAQPFNAGIKPFRSTLPDENFFLLGILLLELCISLIYA
jgi:hypothetical protein